jgi:hypothetical protein
MRQKERSQGEPLLFAWVAVLTQGSARQKCAQRRNVRGRPRNQAGIASRGPANFNIDLFRLLRYNQQAI